MRFEGLCWTNPRSSVCVGNDALALAPSCGSEHADAESGSRRGGPPSYLAASSLSAEDDSVQGTLASSLRGVASCPPVGIELWCESPGSLLNYPVLGPIPRNTESANLDQGLGIWIPFEGFTHTLVPLTIQSAAGIVRILHWQSQWQDGAQWPKHVTDDGKYPQKPREPVWLRDPQPWESESIMGWI